MCISASIPWPVLIIQPSAGSETDSCYSKKYFNDSRIFLSQVGISQIRPCTVIYNKNTAKENTENAITLNIFSHGIQCIKCKF